MKFFSICFEKEWSENILFQLCYAEVPQEELKNGTSLNLLGMAVFLCKLTIK